MVLDLVVESSVQVAKEPSAEVGRRDHLLVEEAVLGAVLVRLPRRRVHDVHALKVVAQGEEKGEVIAGDDVHRNDLNEREIDSLNARRLTRFPLSLENKEVEQTLQLHAFMNECSGSFRFQPLANIYMPEGAGRRIPS